MGRDWATGQAAAHWLLNRRMFKALLFGFLAVLLLVACSSFYSDAASFSQLQEAFGGHKHDAASPLLEPSVVDAQPDASHIPEPPPTDEPGPEPIIETPPGKPLGHAPLEKPIPNKPKEHPGQTEHKENRPSIHKPPEQLAPNPEYTRPEYLTVENPQETDKFAFLLWLSESPSAEEENEKWDANKYFVATRILLWQLLHDPDTKASEDIDIIVMCGPKVSEAHKRRLRMDGAMVYSVDIPHTPNDKWLVPLFDRWIDCFGKLHAWELEEYSRIVVLDGDILLQVPLDGIFHDPGAVLMRSKPEPRKDDEPELPDEYLFCTFEELDQGQHDWPASDKSRAHGYFNGGFFMLKPSRKMYDYYLGIMDIKDRFPAIFMEQAMLNYAHRWDGPMPWREINGGWNYKWTQDGDLDGGAISIHEKWWDLLGDGRSKKIGQFAMSKKAKAEGFWQAQRELLEQ
ncbi:hypothetical protein NLU13_5625 [Sarocladium strictum]|uniref:Hexosyltransferase n=1 Tax=Sarocladium strictum TaxID=5046 RepID=A0AA39GJR6_SARSR|nr:hypothetical protein NLU13_5625 [Sarocladium strictum]